MRVGFYAVDPGVTTGVAMATFEFDGGVGADGGGGWGWRDVVGSVDDFGTHDVHGGGPEEDALSVAAEFSAIRHAWWSLGVRDVRFVMESFELRTAVRGPEVLAPVRVGSLIIGARFGRASMFEDYGLGRAMPVETEWVRPSETSTITSARLRAWGLWERGASDHRKDATRQLLVAAKRYTKSVGAGFRGSRR